MEQKKTYQLCLEEIALKDERVVVMTAENRAAIRSLPTSLGSRFVDTGICEQTMIGMATGLALRGKIPIVHALASFLIFRPYEFIRTDIGISGLPVKLVGAVPGFLSDGNGPTHQAIEDISLMRGIPGMRIFCPADDDDLLLGLSAVIYDPYPWYIRFNSRKACVSHNKVFEIGKAEIWGEGSEVGIITYGTLFQESWAAAELLRSKGVEVQIMNLRSLQPIDEIQILRFLKTMKYIVTVEDHFLTGGLFSILSEIMVKNQIQSNLLPLSLDNRWFRPGRFQEVLEYEGFSSEKIAEKIFCRIQQS